MIKVLTIPLNDIIENVVVHLISGWLKARLFP